MSVKAQDPRPWYIGPGGSTTQSMRFEAQKFARDIVMSDDYRASLRSRAKLGTLPPAVEVMLWHYAWGKPVEQVQVQVSNAGVDLSNLSIEELTKHAEQLAQHLKEARELDELLIATDPNAVAAAQNNGPIVTPPPVSQTSVH